MCRVIVVGSPGIQSVRVLARHRPERLSQVRCCASGPNTARGRDVSVYQFASLTARTAAVIATVRSKAGRNHRRFDNFSFSFPSVTKTHRRVGSTRSVVVSPHLAVVTVSPLRKSLSVRAQLPAPVCAAVCGTSLRWCPRWFRTRSRDSGKKVYLVGTPSGAWCVTSA